MMISVKSMMSSSIQIYSSFQAKDTYSRISGIYHPINPEWNAQTARLRICSRIRKSSRCLAKDNSRISGIKHLIYLRIRIRWFLALRNQDILLFSLDPDPTCNNEFIKLFSSWTKYKPESTNPIESNPRSNFMPTYLKYK